MQSKDFHVSKRSFSDETYDYQIVTIREHPSQPYLDLMRELHKTNSLEPRSLMNLGLDPKVWEVHGFIRGKYQSFVVKKKF